MLGDEGVPYELIKRQLCDFYRCSWLDLDAIDIREHTKALIILGVDADLAREHQTAPDAPPTPTPNGDDLT